VTIQPSVTMDAATRCRRKDVLSCKRQHAPQRASPKPPSPIAKTATSQASPSSQPTSRATIASVLRHHPLPMFYDDGLPSRYDNRSDKVIRMLTSCRHGELGASQYHCGDCGASRVTLNACGDRHCPQCAKQARFQWQAKVKKWALDVDYVHLVTTLPHELNDLVAANDGVLLRALFATTRTSIENLISDHYACKPGLVQVVHTWGQKLGRHYHIHNVMTAGGLSHDGNTWLPIDQDEFETRTIELAARFKKCFLKHLRFLLGQGRLKLPRRLCGKSCSCSCSCSCEACKVAVANLLATIEKKTWVADIGATPLKYRNSRDRQRTIGYLAKYVAGTAIGDGRILSDQDGWVTFGFYDYVTESYGVEKIRGIDFHILFRQHILPARMPRCIMSGLFAPSRRRDGRLELCRTLIDQANQPGNDSDQPRVHSGHDPLAQSPTDEEVTADEEVIDTSSKVPCQVCGMKMTQSHAIKGSDTVSTLRLVPMVVASIVALISVRTSLEATLKTTLSTSLASTIASAIDHIVRARLRADGSQPNVLSLRAYLPDDYFYDEHLHLALSTLVAHQLADASASSPKPQVPP
jgi:hypothetical protein